MTVLFVSFDIPKYPNHYRSLAIEVLQNVLSRTYVSPLDFNEPTTDSSDDRARAVVHI